MKSVTRRRQFASKRPASIRAALMTTAACAVALTGFATAAYAQDATTAAPAEESTTVVVTGIRKGLQDSLSIKKRSTSIVEAVSAEDIGKLWKWCGNREPARPGAGRDADPGERPQAGGR